MPLFKAKGPRKLTAVTKGVIKKNYLLLQL